MFDFETLNIEDVIDVRDIMARVEELEDERDNTPDEDAAQWELSDESKELAALESILEDLKGCGGDEQWRGDWYPVTLIRESYFTDYTEELVCDCYDVKLPDFVHVDWEATAREVKIDYSTVEIDGVTFFYR